MWKRIKLGQFPEPHKFNRITAWRLGDILDYLESAPVLSAVAKPSRRRKDPAKQPAEPETSITSA